MKLEDMMKKTSSGRFKKEISKQVTPTIEDYLSDPNASRPYLDNSPKTKNSADEKQITLGVVKARL